LAVVFLYQITVFYNKTQQHHFWNFILMTQCKLCIRVHRCRWRRWQSTKRGRRWGRCSIYRHRTFHPFVSSPLDISPRRFAPVCVQGVLLIQLKPKHQEAKQQVASALKLRLQVGYGVVYCTFVGPMSHRTGRTGTKYRSWVLVKCVWCGAYYLF